MNLKVLRPADGVMMRLVKYDLAGTALPVTDTSGTIVHNHNMAVG